MGEAKKKQLQRIMSALEPMAVDTPGGRIHVQWDHSATATPNAQLAFLQSSYKPRVCIKVGWIVAPCRIPVPMPQARWIY